MSAPEPQDDVQEFAAQLRSLKERTDRSYGSLARRLNMNTSTLHRYCAGDAVPVDFAPVERFAALCGASAEERMELHRRWLLAVETRQRPRAGEGAAREGGADQGSAPGSGADTHAEAGGGTGMAAVSGGEAAPGAAPEHAADAYAGADDSGMHAGGAPEGEADAVRVGARALVGRPWYRGRGFVVGVAAGVVLLATLGSLAALPSGRSASDEVAQAPDPSSRTTASGTPDRSASPSPSVSTGTRSPSAKGTAKSSATTAPGGGPSAGKSEKPPAGTGTPLTWTVNSHIWNAGCGHDYVIDKPPAQVPPPPTSQDAANWAGTQGAIHGRETMVQISVQGKNSTAVVLEDLRVRVVSRGAPVKGNSYAMDQGCGGALTPRSFSVNLDKDRPIAHSEPGNDGENVIPAVRMPYRVSAEDPEILLVTARTEACDCSWYLELDWSSQGRTGTVLVDDHGRPFRTTGIKGLPRYWYGTNTAGQRAWVDYDS